MTPGDVQAVRDAAASRLAEWASVVGVWLAALCAVWLLVLWWQTREGR